MSLFDDIMSGLEEAIEYEKGILEAGTITADNITNLFMYNIAK